MKKRRLRYYDTYQAIKGRQWVTRKLPEVVQDWEIADLMLNGGSGLVNKKKRSRVGYLETVRNK